MKHWIALLLVDYWAASNAGPIKKHFQSFRRSGKVSVELVCPYCRFSKKVSERKIPAAAKMVICPQCQKKFPLPKTKYQGDLAGEKPFGAALAHGLKPSIDARGEMDGEMGGETGGSPWERRDDLGLFSSIFLTFKRALFHPGLLFSSQSQTEGLREPLAFGLLIGGFGDMLAFFWPALFFSFGFLPFGDAVFTRLSGIWIFLTFMVGIPLAVILNMLIYSGILHLMLLIVRGGKEGYRSTFRVVAYSQAALVWNIIPFMGSWIATVWKLIIQIIGLHEIHQTSYAKIIIAFLLPFFIILALIMMAATPFLMLLF